MTPRYTVRIVNVGRSKLPYVYDGEDQLDEEQVADRLNELEAEVERLKPEIASLSDIAIELDEYGVLRRCRTCLWLAYAEDLHCDSNGDCFCPECWEKLEVAE